MAFYGYARVSTTQQAEESDALEVQGRQLEGWAMIQGLAIDEIYLEPAVSGSVHLRDRPAGAKMLARLKSGDTIIASKLDRMFRSALDALQMVEALKSQGVSLVLLDLGHEPVTNGLSKLFLTISAAFAEMERDRIRERIKGSKADARQRGLYLGGSLPLGYRKAADGSLEAIPEDRAMLETMRELHANGASLRAIQVELDAQHGRKVGLATLSRTLRRPAPQGG